jgi:ribonucleoside-diphosphate reductase alpha chain
MKLSKNAEIVISRFLAKDSEGKVIEKPEQLLKRVAQNIAKEDSKYGVKKTDLAKTEKEFFQAMDSLKFLPNIPVLANAGRPMQQLAACFVLPVPDNLEGIFQSVKDMATIQKSGGGTGFSFSRLRPEGSYVGETSGTASGPVSFMKVFDCATAAIKEGGIRRGANMGVLRVDHPDIEKFINAKESGGLTNFNLSVAITDKFMDSVKKDKDFELVFNKKSYRTIHAKDLFRQIAKHAWINGDPGVIFIDEINMHNPTPKLGEIEATNPCGEQPLLPYESCILGSINLSAFVKNKRFSFKELEKTVQTATHFLDNAIDASSYPLPEIEKIVKANRKIGLGVMGFADALIKLDIAYDSKQAERLAAQITKTIQKTAEKTSEELARIKGNFPNLPNSIFKNKKFRRNATLTTIAPTGVLSILANCSEGIEPLFSLIFNRNSTYGILQETNPVFEDITKKYKLSSETIDTITKQGSIQSTSLPEKIKKTFKTAHDISPEWHLRIQAQLQKNIDNAISKTVNLPERATVDEVERIFLLAHELKCKGLTVYRYNSRREQVLEFCKKCSTTKYP